MMTEQQNAIIENQKTLDEKSSVMVSSQTVDHAASNLIKSGLSVIPVTMPDKRPTISWKEFQSRRPEVNELDYTGAIGVVCGEVSGSLEVVDIDSKNDSSGMLIDELQAEIEKHCPELLSRLVIQ